jgi:hypothetical protein
MWNNLFTIRNWFFTPNSCYNSNYFRQRHNTCFSGSDETGSGVASALKGCHFENTTALNYPVKKGIKLKVDIDLIKIPFRDENGALKSSNQLDEEVLMLLLKLIN